MFEGFGTRAGAGVGVVTLAAAGIAATGNAAVALLALAGGVGAVLLAASRSDEAPAAPAAGTVAEPLLAPVLDAVPEPVLLIADGTVQLANRAARAALGEHIVGEDARVAIRHPAATERLAGAADGSAVELVGAGSPTQRWQMRVTAVGDGRRLVTLVDRSEAHQAERMRVDFVANASHELRTPLAAVLGFIETLEEAGDEPATRARFLGIMGAEAHRMERLVEDLISLSRIEADKYRLPEVALDLAALLESVLGELAGTSARAGDLQAAVEPGVPLVMGDRVQLSQMLHNLVGNALKYGRPGTPVVVSLGRDGALVRLAVRDHGEGIAPEHLPRLTERFYRVDTGRSRSLGGTGLGLAIVKHIVERHRGRLDIVSRVGEGTTVTVCLPPHAGLSSPGHEGDAKAMR